MKIRFKDKNFLLSRISISLMTFYLCGCAATSEYKVSLPSMDDFSSQEVTFNIGGDRLAIEKKIQSFFAQRTQPTIVYQSKSKSYILTGYVPEPTASADRRLRQTAYRFSVSDEWLIAENKKCSKVGVSAITRSKGIREESWRRTESDSRFISAGFAEIQSEMARETCI